jgi:hypothetical protein
MDITELTIEPRVSMTENGDITLMQLVEKSAQGNAYGRVHGHYHVVYSSIVVRGLELVPVVWEVA